MREGCQAAGRPCGCWNPNPAGPSLPPRANLPGRSDAAFFLLLHDADHAPAFSNKSRGNQDTILEPDLLPWGSVGGIEVHELCFEVVATKFLVWAGENWIGISVDSLPRFYNLDSPAVAFGATFWFWDVCARFDVRWQSSEINSNRYAPLFPITNC